MHFLKIHTAIVAGSILMVCGGDAQADQSAPVTASVNSGTVTLTNSPYVPKSRSYIPNSRATAPAAPEAGSATSTVSSVYIPHSRNEALNPLPPAGTDAGAVTDVRFESTSSTAQTNVPVTFGQVFAPGHLTSGASLSGRLANGVVLPLQLDVKARHPDGSVRHAIISTVLPSLGGRQVLAMTMTRTGATTGSPGTTAALLNSGFSASLNVSIDGVRYSASADELIRKTAAKTWLSGSTANEWHVSAPLTTSSGTVHPHLAARFAVRWYGSANKARVDVIVENNWAYEAAPRNFTYDAEVMVGGRTMYAKPSMQHYHHARWRKVFWWNGAAPEVNVKHNTGYLIASRAVPNYDRSLQIPESALQALASRWARSKTEPMGTGLATTYMPQTGGRDDIGLLPQWATVHLLSMDRRARDVTLGTAELAGSFSAHYRDKKTGQPVSLIDYPYMTLVGRAGDAINPATRRSEAFPACAASTACKSPYTFDVSHQPGFAYLPYMLTGDHYFLEELQFWGMYNVFNSNPGYRDNIKGLLKPEQVRGQAWALRTLAEAAYITPDGDRLKEHFNRILDNNLDWYNANYSLNPHANKLGIIVNGYALGYEKGRGVAPWMDDFFTSAVGHAHDLGFTKATTLLKYKAKFPTQRMIGNGACYVRGAMYAMLVRDSASSPFYTTIGQAFKASNTFEFGSGFSNLQCGSADMAAALKLKTGEMTGYAGAYAGYPANMQPALAYAADVAGTEGAMAWATFMSRSVKPDYRFGPQFAIVPR